MTRSKFSTKAVVLATGIGLSIAAFAGSQPAAAQSYSYTCPGGFVYDPTYGCTTAGADDLGYYDYPGGTVFYGRHGDGFGHMGLGAEGTIAHHGMGFHHSIVGVGHFGGGDFGHGMGRAVGVDRGFTAAHFGGGGFAHGMGVVHVGGFGGHGMGGGFHGGGFGGGGHR